MVLWVKCSLLFIFIMNLYFDVVRSSFCLWGSGDYRYLSSKTPYNFVRGDIRDALLQIPECEPIGVWVIMRHGKRNPSSHFAKKMKDTLPIKDLIISSYLEGKSSLCGQDIENLRNMTTHEILFQGIDMLSEDGYQEMIGIGSRLREAFNFLIRDMRDDEYTIKAAFGSRMIDSAKGFAEGLNINTSKIEESHSNYEEIAPYTTCGKYQHDVKNSTHIYTEEVKYLNAKEFSFVKNEIQKRLGIDYVLTNDNIIALYDLCRYTWSGYGNSSSPWCALFTTDELKILEYDGDLRHYYRNGYGTPMNKLLGRIPLANLLRKFRDLRSGKGEKFTGYITHATMIDMLYTALGLFEDKNPLIGEIIDPNRKWRSTFMTAFGANFLSVLYRCNEGNDYKVGFYQNEMPLTSMCNGGLCTWEEFEMKLSPFLNSNTDFCEYKTDLYR